LDDGSFCLGIDVGGTKLSAALFSRDGEIHQRRKLHLNRGGGDEVASQIASLISEYAAGGHAPRAIGIVIPGVVFHSSGEVWAPNIPGWDRYPLRDRLREANDTEVVLDSDRAAYVLGEQWCGAARGARIAPRLNWLVIGEIFIGRLEPTQATSTPLGHTSTNALGEICHRRHQSVVQHPIAIIVHAIAKIRTFRRC